MTGKKYIDHAGLLTLNIVKCIKFQEELDSCRYPGHCFYLPCKCKGMNKINGTVTKSTHHCPCLSLLN